MKMDIKNKWPIAALSLLGMASSASAARDDRCAPEPPATCYQDDCRHCYCLGPENYGVNAPTCPKTCDGDITITVAGFYWNSHQDGMEYAIDNHVQAPVPADIVATIDTGPLNTLVDAEFLTPNFGWDWGFKAGIGYCSPCDGWDIGVLWTWYRGKASSHNERERDDNASLLPLWSAYAPLIGGTLFATDIETSWKLELNLIDIELGRSFWTSKYLSMRPFVGLRIAYINQSYDIEHKGGSWSANANAFPSQAAYNNEVMLTNDFHGVGVRGGLNTLWNLGCGWGIYGNFALAILYGRFDIDHDEKNRGASDLHVKVLIADAKNSFRASRGAADLALGLQWQTMFCDCAYGFSVALGWEHHLFFDQNQLWRVVRIGDIFDGGGGAAVNLTGENVYHERRGDLDTQGWTLTVKFDF
jgi:hypothetical protein